MATLSTIEEKIEALAETGELPNLNIAVDTALDALRRSQLLRVFPVSIVVLLLNILSRRYQVQSKVYLIWTGIQVHS